MKPTARSPLIPLQRIEALVQIEPAMLLVGLAIGTWLFYQVFLRDASPERKKNLRADFRNLFQHVVALAVLTAGFLLGDQNVGLHFAIKRVTPYVGVLALVEGAIVFVKTARIFAAQVLFLGHKREGVPLLLIDTIAAVLSLVSAGWLATQVFQLQLGPVLATSAAASLVLGLALQEPLGNLFAGIALQFDKPFEIGDWVEVHKDGQRWIGQVHEVTWRAATLIGFHEELVSIPNRLIGQAQVTNWSARGTPILRLQTFRLPLHGDLDAARAALTRAVAAVDGVRQVPPPAAYVAEVAETWVVVKVLYSIDDYGVQLAIADRVVPACLRALAEVGVTPAVPRVEVVGDGPIEPRAAVTRPRAVG